MKLVVEHRQAALSIGLVGVGLIQPLLQPLKRDEFIGPLRNKARERAYVFLQPFDGMTHSFSLKRQCKLFPKLAESRRLIVQGKMSDEYSTKHHLTTT